MSEGGRTVSTKTYTGDEVLEMPGNGGVEVVEGLPVVVEGADGMAPVAAI